MNHPLKDLYSKMLLSEINLNFPIIFEYLKHNNHAEPP